MDIPISVLFVPYVIGLIMYVIVSLLALYHVARYESFFAAARVVTFAFIVGTLLILIITLQSISDVPWGSTVTTPFTVSGQSQL